MPTPQQRFADNHRRQHDAFMHRVRQSHHHDPQRVEISHAPPTGGVKVGLFVFFAFLGLVMLGVVVFIGAIAVKMLSLDPPF